MNSTEKLKDDLRMVVSDIEELLKATAGQTSERVSAARSRVEASLHSAKDRLDDLGNAAAASAKRAALDTDRYVHENVWQSIGIAAGIGVLIGFILGRR